MASQELDIRALRINTASSQMILGLAPSRASSEEPPRIFPLDGGCRIMEMEEFMHGVSIADLDQRRVLKIDLADVLAAVGDAAEKSNWALSGVEALGGDDAEELQRISDEQRTIDGKSLALRAKNVSQVIEGEFRAFRGTAPSPWLVIQAIDSSAYDLFTDDEQVLSRVRAKFECVRDIPESLHG